MKRFAFALGASLLLAGCGDSAAPGSSSQTTRNPADNSPAKGFTLKTTPPPTTRNPADYFSGKLTLSETEVTLHEGRQPLYWEVLQGNAYYSITRQQTGGGLEVLLNGKAVAQCDGYMKYVRGQSGEPDSGGIGYIPVSSGVINVAGWEHLNKSDWVLLDFFSVDPSMSHFAFGVLRKGRWQNSVDGVLGTAYDRITPVVFNSDGTHWAFSAKSDNRWCVVLDGKPDAWQAEVKDIRFAPVGSVVGYIASQNGKSRVVIAGRAGGEFLECDSLQMSSDGNHFTYRARTEAGWRVVCDDIQSDPFDAAGKPAVSCNGKHFAYCASRNGKTFLFKDGQQDREIPATHNPSIVVKNDGQVTALLLNTNRTFFQVIVGDVETGPWEACSELLVNPSGTSVVFSGLRDGKTHVIQDGKLISKHDQVTGLRFSPGGGHVAFSGKDGDRWRVRVGGMEGTPCDSISQELFFSSNGAFMSYFIFNRDRTVQACVNGKISRPFVQCGKPALVDGKLVFYGFTQQHVLLVECK